MISNFDDYCVHQTTTPITRPAHSDRNFYDRYWCNGIDPEGNWMFEVGLGLYPNRLVMDSHFSVSFGDRQHAFHGSRRAPYERGETVVGPMKIEVLEPMRRLRVALEPNEQGIECDLVFAAQSIPHEEPPNEMYDDIRLLMLNSRFTQMGVWSGHFTIDGQRSEVNGAIGARDKSWGIRPCGEPPGGAPGINKRAPGVYWCWVPLHFGDVTTQMGTFQDPDGTPTQCSADLLPLYAGHELIPQGEDPGRTEMAEVSHSIQWEKGTRRPLSAEVRMTDRSGQTHEISLEKMLHFQMLGLGYGHPQWAHGVWQGELKTAREDWDLTALDPLALEHLHVHTAMRARMGERTGIGTMENIVIGTHQPSGFADFLDGAP